MIRKNSSSTAVCEKPVTKTEQLPPWNIILHNDDENTAEFVINKVQEITKLEEKVATSKVLEADDKGLSVLLSTHKEKGEFLVEMFQSCHITVTMEKT